jgi:hypothetical protein
MKRNVLKRAIGAAFAVAILGAGTTAATAQSARYCNDYAHDYAARNAVGTGLIGGAAIGALGGAVIGGMFAGSAGVGTGAAIGGGLGAAAGAHSPYSYRALYNAGYRRCMRGRTVSYGRPAPWTPAWYDYCSARYRSFNPDTGKYLTYGGTYRTCR